MRSIRPTKRLGVLLAVFFTAQVASAATPISQDRSIRAFNVRTDYFFSPPVETETLDESSAPDFLPWVDTVNAQDADASQDSSINTAIPGSLALSAQGSMDTMPPAIGSFIVNSSEASSIYSVTFQVDVDSTYNVLGTFQFDHEDCGFASDASVNGRSRLTGPSGVVNEATYAEVSPGSCGFPDLPPCATTLPVAASGLLVPGTYTYEASAEVSASKVAHPNDFCGSTFANANFDVQLDVVAVQTVPALTPFATLLCVLGSLGITRFRNSANSAIRV